jgi:hypothetical protein
MSDKQKMDLPFEIPERTQFSDEGYGVLGRAIAFAADFEGNCRAFATLIGLKDEPSVLRDEQSFNEFCAFIEKRNLFTHLKTIGEKFQFTEDVNTVLKSGREARNYIAHGAGLGLTHILENENRRKNFIDGIEKNVREIVEANLIILFLSNFVTDEPNPTSEYLRGYVNCVCCWVCEAE